MPAEAEGSNPRKVESKSCRNASKIGALSDRRIGVSPRPTKEDSAKDTRDRLRTSGQSICAKAARQLGDDLQRACLKTSGNLPRLLAVDLTQRGSAMPPTASPRSLPKRDQFPTPVPLTPEERALIALAQLRPAEAEAIAELQKKNSREIEIPPIEIPPLRIDGNR